MQKCFGGPKRQFPATNHISGHFRPNGKSYFEKSKIPKFAKKSILAKNSNFDRVADIGRNDDIWPEMGPGGVLELFCTKNRYLNPSRSHFKKSRKIDFFELFNCGVTPKIQSQNILQVPKFRYRNFYGSKHIKTLLEKKCRR